MAKANGLTHILTELSSLEELASVRGRSARLKYTCLSVSKKYIALGSNTGGVYIFSRDTLKYLQVAYGDTDASPVLQVSLSPGDQHVGIGLSTGHIVVFELNIEKRTKPERVRMTYDHVGHQIKAFAWDAACSKLFVGDDTGKISIVLIPSSKTKTLFSVPSEVIVYLESNIYQIDWWRGKLLVSTMNHTHLIDTTKHNYSTIGTKKRDGEFGSCFFLEPHSQCPVIYCARPSSRIWEVDFQGKVLNTHQFKQLLAVAPVPVVNFGEDRYTCTNREITGQSVNFLKMFRLGQFLVTWSHKGIYLFDPINVKILVWTEDIKGIQDMAVINNDIYLFLETGLVRRLVLLPIYQLFTILTKRCLWSLMASLLIAAEQIKLRPAAVRKIKQDFLSSVLTNLREEGKEHLADRVEALLDNISDGSVDSMDSGSGFVDSAEIMGHTYLPTGMVVVSEGVKDSQIRPGQSRQTKSNGSYPEADISGELQLDDIPKISDLPPIVLYKQEENGIIQDNTDANKHAPDSYLNMQPSERELLISSDTFYEQKLPQQKSDSVDGCVSSDPNDEIKNSIGCTIVVNTDKTNLDFVEIPLSDENNGLSVYDREKGQAESNNLICPSNVFESDNGSSHLVSAPIDCGLTENGTILTEKRKEETQIFSIPNSEENGEQVSHDTPLKSEAELKANKNNQFTSPDDSCVESLQIENSFSDPLLNHIPQHINSEKVSSNPELEFDSISKSKFSEIIVDNVTNCQAEYKRKDEVDVASDMSTTVAASSSTTIAIPAPIVAHQKENHHSGDDLIAQPYRRPKKKKKNTTKDCLPQSVSFDPRKSSFDDDMNNVLLQHVETEYDTLSMDTVSSLDDEEPHASHRLKDQDTISCTGDFEFKGRRTLSNEFSISPSDYRRKSSFELGYSANETRELSKLEVIPTLKERLAAARGSFGSEEMMYTGQEDSPSQSPLTSSGEHFLHSRAALSALKDGLSLKFKSQTKSLIKTFKERNLLMAKSSSSPHLSDLPSPQDPSLSMEEDEVNFNIQESEKLSIEQIAASAVDINSLAAIAVTLERRLREWSTLIKPAAVAEILNEWMKELYKAMVAYHTELLKLKNVELEVQTEQPIDVETKQHTAPTLSTVFRENVSLCEDVSQSVGTSPSKSDIISSRLNVNIDGQDNSATNLSHVTTSNPEDTGLSSSSEKVNSVFPDGYWCNIVHASDPLFLSSEHLDLFQRLTTMCFLCGVSGNPLAQLNLEDISCQIQCVQSLLPSLDFKDVNSKLQLSDKIFNLLSSPHMPSQPYPRVHQKDKHICESSQAETDTSNAIVALNTNNKHNCSLLKDNSEHQQEINNIKSASVTEQFETDLNQAIFLCLYFFLLDYKRVKQELDKMETSSPLSWAACLRYSQVKGQGDIVSTILMDKQINSAFDYLRSGILPHQSALLGHVYSLFTMSPSKASEFCAELKREMTALDLIYFCVHSGQPQGPSVLKYTKKIMEELAPLLRASTLQKLCACSHVRRILIEELIPTLSQDATIMVTLLSSKSEASQLISLLTFDWLNLMLSLVTSQEEQECTLALCINFSCWKVCVRILKSSGDWQRLIDLIVDINDITMLSEAEGFQPRNLDEWKYLLKAFQTKCTLLTSDSLKSKKKYLNCEDVRSSQLVNAVEQQPSEVSSSTLEPCDTKTDSKTVTTNFDNIDKDSTAISWNSLGYLLLSHIGGSLAIDVLTEYLDNPEVSTTCLTADFLAACYTHHSIQMEQQHLSHEMLEKVSMYLWAKKPGFVTPSVYETLKVERRSVEIGDGNDTKVQGMCVQVQGTSSQDLMTEYLPGHWGQEVNINRLCPCCNLALKAIVSLSTPGVLIFPCGHAFHKQCVPRSVCPLDHSASLLT